MFSHGRSKGLRRIATFGTLQAEARQPGLYSALGDRAAFNVAVSLFQNHSPFTEAVDPCNGPACPFKVCARARSKRFLTICPERPWV